MYLYDREKKDFPSVTEAKRPTEVPNDLHYAIIIFDSTSVFIPGDERSRTNPGHGYPERTENYNTFQYFYTKDLTHLNKFIKYLCDQDKYKNRFVFFEVQSLGKVNLSVNLSF